MMHRSSGSADAVLPDRQVPLPSTHVQHVCERLRKGMDQHGLDALIAFSAENIYYSSGQPSFWAYQSSESGMPLATVLREPDLGRILVCDVFESMAVTSYDDLTILAVPSWVDIQNPLNYEGVQLTTERPSTASKVKALHLLTEEVKSRLGSGARVGVDERSCNRDAWEALAEALTDMTLVPASQIFSEARAVKSEWEIEQLTIANEITENAISSTVELLRTSVSESEIIRHLRRAFLADPRCTDVRFALAPCGKNFTMTLWPVRHTELKDGDVMKFDCGAEVNGYGVDISRSFAIGHAPRHVGGIYDALHSGYEALISGAVPGRPLADLFNEAMDVVRRSGLPNYSRGHLGHGVGLEKMVEEWPFVGGSATTTLEVGMVLSLEVPYYGYGVGALNIEDTIVIRESGPQNLTTLSADLIVC
jgi:Xaa-Pro aminopeptidase